MNVRIVHCPHCTNTWPLAGGESFSAGGACPACGGRCTAQNVHLRTIDTAREPPPAPAAPPAAPGLPLNHYRANDSFRRTLLAGPFDSPEIARLEVGMAGTGPLDIPLAGELVLRRDGLDFEVYNNRLAYLAVSMNHPAEDVEARVLDSLCWHVPAAGLADVAVKSGLLGLGVTLDVVSRDGSVQRFKAGNRFHDLAPARQFRDLALRIRRPGNGCPNG